MDTYAGWRGDSGAKFGTRICLGNRTGFEQKETEGTERRDRITAGQNHLGIPRPLQADSYTAESYGSLRLLVSPAHVALQHKLPATLARRPRIALGRRIALRTDGHLRRPLEMIALLAAKEPHRNRQAEDQENGQAKPKTSRCTVLHGNPFRARRPTTSQNCRDSSPRQASKQEPLETRLSCCSIVPLAYLFLCSRYPHKTHASV